MGLKTVSATIAADETLSGVIGLGDYVIVGIQMPAGWDAAALTFKTTINGAEKDVYDSSGSELNYTVSADRYIAVDPLLWIGINDVQIRSGTSGTPVDQTAERVITVLMKELV